MFLRSAFGLPQSQVVGPSLRTHVSPFAPVMRAMVQSLLQLLPFDVVRKIQMAQSEIRFLEEGKKGRSSTTYCIYSELQNNSYSR